MAVSRTSSASCHLSIQCQRVGSHGGVPKAGFISAAPLVVGTASTIVETMGTV